jgi:hypothetical protein
MKKFFLPVVICVTVFSQTSFAQLTDTKWQGVFYIPSETECYMHFKKDTLDLVTAESGAVIEGMKYSIAGDTLTITKLYGGSPCGDDAGVYTWKINADKLKLTFISDNCGARASAGLDNELTKINIPDIKKEND